MSERFDLHTHSVHSDGTSTVEEISKEAHTLGLAGYALTDHDTTEGWPEAQKWCDALGIDFLPGMEITTKHDWRSTHLLAYGFDPNHLALATELQRVRESRLGRAREMVDRISADFDIDWISVIEHGDAQTIGRPHIADALVRAGYFVDRSAAFDQVLHPTSPYYVPTYAIETLDAIELVRSAGGLTVLAHPAASRMSRPTTRESIEQFVEAGLWGIELNHPENRDDWLPQLHELALKHQLRITGASDYHGAGKPNLLGECTSGSDIWNELQSRTNGRTKVE